MNDTDKKSGKGEENCEGVTFERMVEKVSLLPQPFELTLF